MTQKEIAKLKRDKKKAQGKVKKVSIYVEIDNYLFNGTEISADGLNNKTPLRTAITYLFESFMLMPKVSIHLDKHLNQKVENLLTHDLLDILDFYKLIIKEHGIKRFQLYKCFPNRKFGQDINTIKNKLGITNSEAKAYLINRIRLNPEELESILGNKALVVDTNLNNEILKAIEMDKNNIGLDTAVPDIMDLKGPQEDIPMMTEFEVGVDSTPISNPLLQDENKSTYVNEDKFLPYLDQSIITDLSLSLFDIRILRNENKFLYIFIDKHNRKRYFKDNFKAEFFISKKSGVINNSYIEENSEDYIKYIVTNHLDLNNIRYLLDQEYRKEILFQN